MKQQNKLRDLIRDTFSIHKGDRDLTVDSVVKQLTPQSAIFREYRSYLIRKAVRTLLHEEIRQRRTNNKLARTKSDPPGLLAYPLSTQKFLARAYKDEIDAEVAVHTTMIEGNLVKRAFFEEVSTHLSPFSPVEQQLTGADLVTIAENVGFRP